MDRQSVYTLDLWGENRSNVSEGQESNRQLQKKLVDFILSFAVDNAFIYRCGHVSHYARECELT